MVGNTSGYLKKIIEKLSVSAEEEENEFCHDSVVTNLHYTYCSLEMIINVSFGFTSK